VPGIPAVYLFGSRVRGDHRKDGDVDFVCFSINGDLTKLPRKKRTCRNAQSMSLLGGTWLWMGFMSAFDPKRTLPSHEAAAKNWR
jgi:hypothetical protein